MILSTRSVFVLLLLSSQADCFIGKIFGAVAAPFKAIGRAVGIGGGSKPAATPAAETPAGAAGNGTGDGGEGGSSKTDIHKTAQNTNVNSANGNQAQSRNNIVL